MTSTAVLATLALLAGAQGPPPAPAPPPASCRPIDGLAPLLLPGQVILLGEIHGAAEPPRFTLDVVCAALAKGLDVTVELEIWIAEDAKIQAFLASPGAHEDVAALLKGEFWQQDYQDGRPSRARLEMLDGLRRMRASGAKVKVVLLDPVGSVATDRDRGMAERLGAAVDASPAGLHVVLVGNVHSSLDIGTPWDPKFENAAYLFARGHPKVKAVALNIARTGGTAWTCPDGDPRHCGPGPVKGDPAAGSWNVLMYTDGRHRGHDGTYGVGALTASPPAKDVKD